MLQCFSLVYSYTHRLRRRSSRPQRTLQSATVRSRLLLLEPGTTSHHWWRHRRRLRFSGSVWRQNFSLGRTAWTRADSPSFPQTTQLAWSVTQFLFYFHFLLVTRPWSLRIYASTVTIVFILYYIYYLVPFDLKWQHLHSNASMGEDGFLVVDQVPNQKGLGLLAQFFLETTYVWM